MIIFFKNKIEGTEIFEIFRSFLSITLIWLSKQYLNTMNFQNI